MAIDEEAFEAAREAWLFHASDYTRLDECIRAALEAYESAKQKDGWVLVPKEPTKAMLDAYGMKAWEINGDSAAGLLVEGYRAMLAVAPEPPSALLSAGGEG